MTTPMNQQHTARHTTTVTTKIANTPAVIRMRPSETRKSRKRRVAYSLHYKYMYCAYMYVTQKKVCLIYW